MGWLKKRFGETSTYKGLALVGAMATMLAGPVQAAEAAQMIGTLLGVWEVVRTEK